MPKAPANTNTRIWDVLGKTDPAHTSSFSRSGGFKGTAMKPIWIVKRMTEQFGPVGEGWGMEKPEFQLVHTGPGDEIMVYCTVGVWHTDRSHLFYGVGGDKVTASRKSGNFNSDEAFKMAYTDAVNNALKYLGVGADIHMGQFDDSKYVQEMRAEFAVPPPELEDLEAFVKAIPDAATEDDLKALLDKAADAIDALADGPFAAKVTLAKQQYVARKRALKEPEPA